MHIIILTRYASSGFVLRQAQHERQILTDFTPRPVRPEPVEGGTAGVHLALPELPEN